MHTCTYDTGSNTQHTYDMHTHTHNTGSYTAVLTGVSQDPFVLPKIIKFQKQLLLMYIISIDFYALEIKTNF